MLHIIAGRKGKVKTKYLLDKANAAVKEATGSTVYVDKNDKHMHELSNRVRLIDISQYPIRSYHAFVGFICGIISQDYDLQEIYLDSFLKVSHLEGQDITASIKELAAIADEHNLEMTLSVSMDEIDLPEGVAPFVEIAL